jgi:hypothetical protein
VTPELERLLEVLEGHRAAVLKKLAGLSEDDARRSTVPSGTNVAGLVQHLTYAESKWFEGVAAGGAVHGLRTMLVAPEVSLRELRTRYREACAASNAIIARLGSADVPVTYNGKDKDLRFVMLAMIGETARHAGHADIIREQIDGTTGQ